MTLNEAIIHAKEVAKEQEAQAWEAQLQEEYGMIKPCKECAAEHKQLAEWLKELKSLKEKNEAKAVCYEGDGYADGAMVYDYAFCPSCDHETEIDSENWGCEFCPECGQKLRWEE